MVADSEWLHEPKMNTSPITLQSHVFLDFACILYPLLSFSGFFILASTNFFFKNWNIINFYIIEALLVFTDVCVYL